MATDVHHEDHEAAGDEAAHAHHAFDPEPIAELPADEPHTPLWMPAVGLALLVIFGTWLALGGDEPSGEDQAEEAAPTATATALPAAPANPRPAPTVRPAEQLSPEQRKQIEERLRELRERGGTAPGIRPIPQRPADQGSPADQGH